MNPGAEPAPAAHDGLLLRLTFFAPALCWWARTLVELITAYSLSALRTLHQRLKDPLPHASRAPPGVTGRHDTELPKALRQISPGNACPVAIEQGTYEQPVVFGSDFGLPCVDG